MTLKHNGIKYPRMTEMLSEADGSAQHGLMPWVARCAVEWIRENAVTKFNSDVGGEDDKTIYLLDDIDLEQARFHYKTVSQEALDVGSEVHRLIEEFLNEQTRD